jgi:MYXO-CTERM domain-containing protein
VLEFVLSGTAGDGLDAVSMYLDPTTAAKPAIPNATRVGSGAGTPDAFDFTLGAIGAGSFGSTIAGTTTVYDEVRVATTFAEALPPFPLPGDTNGDGFVDLLDYNNIVNNFGRQVTTALEGDVAKADGSQGADGRVNIADYRIWRDHRTDVPPGTPHSLGVPEPSGLALAGLAVLCGARLRRRRK